MPPGHGSAEPTVSRRSGEGPVSTVLVVDDDATLRALLRDVLESAGHEVQTACDGFAALRAVQSARPDCVLLDVMMPGLDGHEVLSRLRQLDRRGSLPVVMLTAADDDTNARRAWGGGVDYLLGKPFDVDELLACVERLVVPDARRRRAG